MKILEIFFRALALYTLVLIPIGLVLMLLPIDWGSDVVQVNGSGMLIFGYLMALAFTLRVHKEPNESVGLKKEIEK